MFIDAVKAMAERVASTLKTEVPLAEPIVAFAKRNHLSPPLLPPETLLPLSESLLSQPLSYLKAVMRLLWERMQQQATLFNRFPANMQVHRIFALLV